MKNLLYNYSIINKKFNFLHFTAPLHVIRPFKKTDVKEAINYFYSEVQTTLKNRFRKEDDLMLYAIEIYLYNRNLIDINLYKFKINLTDILKHIFKNIPLLELYVGSKNINRRLYKLKLINPNTICFNEGEESTKKNIDKVKKFLSKYFDKKSSYEK